MLGIYVFWYLYCEVVIILFLQAFKRKFSKFILFCISLRFFFLIHYYFMVIIKYFYCFNIIFMNTLKLKLKLIALNCYLNYFLNAMIYWFFFFYLATHFSTSMSVYVTHLWICVPYRVDYNCYFFIPIILHNFKLSCITLFTYYVIKF